MVTYILLDSSASSNAITAVELSQLTSSSSLICRSTARNLPSAWVARKEKATAASNYRMIESAWRVHVAPKWTHRHVSDVTVVDVEAWVAQMARDGCGTTTVLRAHGVLSGIMADAVKARRTRPRASKIFHARLRVDTYTCRPTMFSAGGRGGRTRRLGADAGVRRPAVGEAIPLRVRDVEFLKRRMVVL